MTKSAITRGFARWVGRNVVPHLAPRGALRVAVKGAIALAEKSPDTAIALLALKFPSLKETIDQFVGAGDDAVDALVESLKAAAGDENGMVVQFCEVGLWNNEPHSLVVTPDLIDELYAEMKRVEKGEETKTLEAVWNAEGR